MADNSRIEWTDTTWNPVAGCSPVSPACTYCYAARDAVRLEAMGQAKYQGTAERRGKTAVFTGRVNFDEKTLDKPLRWKRPRRIFVNSMSDLFHENVPDEWIDRIFAVMALCPQHTFQVLTKRPERMYDWISRSMYLVNAPLANVWLGVTVEDQQRADERIPLLAKTPAALRFLSCEPLLGPVDLEYLHRLQWVITGGESGPHARPSHPDWFRSLRDQCQAAGVPFFFKQWGEWSPPLEGERYNTLYGRAQAKPTYLVSRSDGTVHCTREAAGQDAAVMIRRTKRAAGRLLDGREWNEFPDQVGVP